MTTTSSAATRCARSAGRDWPVVDGPDPDAVAAPRRHPVPAAVPRSDRRGSSREAGHPSRASRDPSAPHEPGYRRSVSSEEAGLA